MPNIVSKNWPSFLVSIPERCQRIVVVAVLVLTGIGRLRYSTIYRPPGFNQLGREYMVLLLECLEYTRDIIVLVCNLNFVIFFADWNKLRFPDDSYTFFISKFLY